ncbi:MAG: phenylacetate--CoA ligase family protein [Ruminococcaceae bacterium]|nr:phenylacetate--CoA ligase family protein [Oscillospiraceae bacterium]
MGRLQAIYDKMPICIQNLMTSVSGYQKCRQRYGKAYYERREFLKGFDKLPLNEKLEYQRKKLWEFIRFAKENSRFYEKLYKDIDLEGLSTVDDLKKLPIVDKEMLRANIEEVYTVQKKYAVESHTGGTTGKSLTVRGVRDDMMYRMATLDHFKARLGFENRKMKRATFNGKHIVPPKQKKKIFWRYNRSCKQMIYSSFHITEENLGAYVKSLNKFKPMAIDGFFTSMCDVASYIERNNIKLDFKPVAIFPTSETVTESGRELLTRVFGCEVYDQYASSEGAPFITECCCHHLHTELSTGVFEHFIDGSDEVLVTSFVTRGTPLIRYKIGDCVAFSDSTKTCECGRHDTYVTSIQGRRLDYLYTASGAKINAGNVSNIFKNLPNVIIRSQALQKQLGEITILLEVDKKLYKPEYDEIIRDEFKHKFGTDTEIILKHVDSISREKSGKFKFIVNKVDK